MQQKYDPKLKAQQSTTVSKYKPVQWKRYKKKKKKEKQMRISIANTNNDRKSDGYKIGDNDCEYKWSVL